MEPTPIVEKPNAPLIYQDDQGRDLCAECAEDVDASGDIIVFVNWQDYDHRCMLCDARFALDAVKSGDCNNCGLHDDNLVMHNKCGLWFCIGCWDKKYDECPHCEYSTPKEWTDLN